MHEDVEVFVLTINDSSILQLNSPLPSLSHLLRHTLSENDLYSFRLELLLKTDR